MLDPVGKAELEQSVRTVRVIHTAMVVSILAYLGIAYVVLSRRDPVPGGEGILASVLYVLSGLTIVGVFAVRRLVLPAPDELKTASGDSSEMISKYRMGSIISFVLCEAIALYGLVLAFVSGSMAHLLRLAAVSIVLLLFLYPRNIE
ncbi:MAG: hypothetical protein AB1898_04985 [Acidobacteriota bacterium]